MSASGTKLAVEPSRTGLPWHWAPIAVFILYAAINMLDRQLLAAVAPALKTEFHLSNAQYGGLVSVFYAVSTAAAPLAGLFIDAVGLKLGASLAIIVWSLAGAATGWTHTLRGLIVCRFGLGLGESGGSGSPGATLASYMNAAELSLGAALLGLGTSLGSLAAPLIAAAVSPHYGWRSVFVICGALGLAWVPLWLFTAKLVPPGAKPGPRVRTPFRSLLRDRRFWGVTLAYALVRQTLWVNWTTIYFVQERHLTLDQANQRFAWFPPVFGTLGGFAVGALAMRWVRRGMSGLAARERACWLMAPLLFATAAVPFLASTAAAAAAVGVTMFAGVCIWTSVHLMPIDLYGVERAAFTYSLLDGVLALSQTATSPAIGAMVDHFGFTPVCVLMPMLPLAGLATLRICLGRR